ncbi:MAG: conjugal transfer protein TraM [Burkholderiaceae bacterium]|nr:conjugal transfer protein TraM [Burkholderiaceae bacterium]
MTDPVEELIKEIAARHGIAVSRDDPIMVLQTINSRLMQDSAKAQQVQLDHYKEELESLALRWGNEAKGKAERIVNASLAASKEAMGQILQDAAKATAASLQAEMDAALAGVAAPIRDARRIAMLNVVASCITLLAAAVALWVTLR